MVPLQEAAHGEAARCFPSSAANGSAIHPVGATLVLLANLQHTIENRHTHASDRSCTDSETDERVDNQDKSSRDAEVPESPLLPLKNGNGSQQVEQRNMWHRVQK